jgi:uncharacterized protein YhhL (DUF1145 family)
MLWRIYTVLFLVINAASLIAFDYRNFDYVAFISLVLSVGLNIAVYSYAFKKPVLTKIMLDWLFKLNIAMFGVFLFFEFITFLQEIIGAGINLPTSGVVSIIASFPAIPALYATYRLAYVNTEKSKKSKKKKSNS